MPITIKKVHEAFEYLFKKLNDKNFSKTLGFEEWGERNLLPLVRTYLLGYFGELVRAEVRATLTHCSTGFGRIDFLIDDVAVEFAVRKSLDTSNRNVLNHANKNEVKKLLKYPSKSILVLFDFSSMPLNSCDLDRFRELPSLGQGNHSKYPFQISYFYKHEDEIKCHKKHIRIC